MRTFKVPTDRVNHFIESLYSTVFVLSVIVIKKLLTYLLTLLTMHNFVITVLIASTNNTDGLILLFRLSVISVKIIA